MSNIHYGLAKKAGGGHLPKILKNKERIDERKTETLANKSDIATLKSDLLAEKLKVSTNKTNISVNKVTITSEKTKLTQTRTKLHNLTTQVTTVENTASQNTMTSVDANSRSKENRNKIATEKARVTANATAIALRPISITTYLAHIPDLSSTYQTSSNIPNHHWPYPLMSFGTVDAKTTFRIVNITMDEDVVVPTNLSVTFLMKAYTTATGSQSEETIATLNLSTFRIPGKPYYNINKDYKLSAIFPTNYTRLGCGHLYMKHNHGVQNITVELVIVCAIVQD